MPKIAEIEKAWFDFITATINQDFPAHSIIFSQQDGPRPQKPYLTLKITGPTRIMNVEPLVYNADADKFQIETHRRYNMSIQSYGVDHVDVLDDIILGSQIPDFRKILRDCDIGLEIRGSVTDLTGLTSTAWEKRGSLDISFIASKIKLTNIEPIESAEISGDLDKNDESNKIVNNFTVPEP